MTEHNDRARQVPQRPESPQDTECDSPQARIALIVEHLGDPNDPDNPLGFAALLAAERQEKSADNLATAFELDAELVPGPLGGRFRTLEWLVRIGRAVVRRAPGLAPGWLTGSVLGAASVWLAGDDRQRAQVAGLLMAGGRLACGVGEDDLAERTESHPVILRAGRDGPVLNGRTGPLPAVDRADMLVLVAQAGTRPTLWSRTPLLLTRAGLADARVTVEPRPAPSGTRYGVVDFDGHRITDEAVLRGVGDVGGLDGFGGIGASVQMVRLALALNRTVVTAMLTAALDTALSIVARETSRAPRPADAVRTGLVDVFVALTAAETLTDAVTRSAHVYPGESGLHAAAVSHGVAGLVTESLDRLAGIVREHGRDDATEIRFFWQLRRDVAAILDRHVDPSASRRALLAQLPSVARRGWRVPAPAAATLFLRDPELPELQLGGLPVAGNGNDHLAASLPVAVACLTGADPHAVTVADLAAPLVGELAALRAECEQRTAPDLAAMAEPDAIALADRYLRVLIGSACVQTWWHNRGGDRRGRTFDLLIATLDRLSGNNSVLNARTGRLFGDLHRRAAITVGPPVSPPAARLPACGGSALLSSPGRSPDEPR